MHEILISTIRHFIYFSLIGLRMGLTALSTTIKHFFDQAAENYIVNFIAKNQEKTSPELKEAN